ncbi:hypothetical protein [Natranaeroarchaeum aerophilus]|uniref:Uncharacterized protein n=1 Tax=Natranaeroarchaeum aerophilus TaxID=2917711 RepID=A0AAE3FS62_9EURY|nr:hypothetical protein [Natranaeroarchaeum aerophilus]MCL9814687.1 hypothetical protein [Natranaeroarchaeum aerophilus]
MEPSLATLTVPLQFAFGVLAGLLATLAMDRAMGALPEGPTPPFVAAAVLTETTPRAAPERLAFVIHYLAGVFTGPLFVWLLLTSEGLFGRGVTATLVAAGVLYALMVGFFVLIPLAQVDLHPNRRSTVGRDWALSAAVYVAVLVPVVSVVFVLL